MSDGGRGWYPGDEDPRYDPYAPPQQQPPSGYGRPPQQGQGRGSGYGQGQNQGAPGQGRRQGGAPGYGEGDPYQNPQGGQGYGRQPAPGGYRQPPPRGPQGGGRYPEERAVPRQRPAQPWDAEPTRADVWSAGENAAGRDELGESRGSRRRRGAAEGVGAAGAAAAGPSHVNDDIDLDEVDPHGKAQRAWAKQQELANRPPSKMKQATKWTALGMSVVVLAGVCYGAYVYETTVGSIKHTALLPPGMSEASLPADPYGHSAQNILLIGSDTRDTAADCQLGNDCGPGSNADSEMILHVSAEGTDATILSIPRDTVASLPNCAENNGVTTLTGSYSTYQINSALQYGPECQVAADHYLTKITITGYMLFDFSGIVTMSNALGGVPVCVTSAVNDKDSGLKLPAGTSTIQGNTVLEFLRTRHSFFDGSDLGREEATHYFLAQMIQTLRKSMNFSDVTQLISIGQAAAKAMTVSDNYAGLTNLEGLVESLNRVPTKNITMLTMPWEYDPTNQSRVIPSSAAKAVFAAIQGSTSFTNTTKSSTSTAGKSAAGASASPTAAASASTSASVNKGSVPVNVYNADGVSGRATTVKQGLISDGFTNTVSAGNASTVSASQVTYDPNEATQAEADAVAAALGISTSEVSATTNWKGVSVFIGTDFTSGTTLGASTGSTASTPSADTSGAATAPADSHESFASGSENECIPVESGTLTMASK
jgi:LCP family protein required for cell wall assembly